jgi:hypothetical protein
VRLPWPCPGNRPSAKTKYTPTREGRSRSRRWVDPVSASTASTSSKGTCRVSSGVDISTVFIGAAQVRAVELGVADQVSFMHGDASDYVADQPVDLASCVGATWIGGGVPGTVGLLRRSLSPRGTMVLL